ncbi:sulfotransferase domain protein [Thioploca ingrica]|uniref:Sulfotransferase domain protein n=1 Tax=Thioploca ingrica TaxID=40754 RepID=A0A090ADJ8_9GAMM|nr:sulfotransferase domain protein [Thioploca ingrica]
MKIEESIRKADYWATPIYEHPPSWFFPERHLKFKVFVDSGLYTLDSYFSWWNTHNTKVFTTVLPERLLIVKTRELTQSIPQIERFLGITLDSLPTSARGNVTTKKFGILSQIDKNFLEEKANFHCQKLMSKYFPEVKGSLFHNARN